MGQCAFTARLFIADKDKGADPRRICQLDPEVTPQVTSLCAVRNGYTATAESTTQ